VPNCGSKTKKAAICCRTQHLPTKLPAAIITILELFVKNWKLIKAVKCDSSGAQVRGV
jgi:hypothetical protein